MSFSQKQHKENLENWALGKYAIPGTPIRIFGSTGHLKAGTPTEPLENTLECRYTSDGFVVIGGRTDQGVIRVDRDGNVQWRQTWAGGVRMNGLDYNPSSDQVIVTADLDGTYRVAELDGDTGDILRSTDAFAPELWGGAVAYDPVDPDAFWVSEMSNDRVLKGNWDGTTLWNSATQGLNLTAPTSVDVLYSQPAEARTILIGDTGANRALRSNEAGNILDQFPFPGAKIRQAPTASLIQIYFNELQPTAAPGGGNRWPYSIISSGGLTRPFSSFIPYLTKPLAFKPGDPYTVAFGKNHGLNEAKLPLYSAKKFSQLSRTVNIWDANSIAAATAETSPPIPCFMLKPTVYVKPTQAGTLTLQTARFVGRGGKWDGGWDDVDSVSLTANTLSSYTPTWNPGVFRFKVDLDADGSVDAWVNLEA